MKRFVVASFCMLFLSAPLSLHAQVAPAATSGTFSVNAGGLGSVSQPDYAGEGIAQTSPNRLYGAGAYVDLRFNRWVTLEGEGRWLTFNEYLKINEKTYLVGPRIPIGDFHRFTPYGKVLVGMGNGSFLTGHTFVLAYGGGLDYRLSKRFTIRCADFEYQQWHVTPTIWPYGGSVGISYKVFGP
ncbi:MAG: outer membrane beta-barrel protein [Terracidiphilus sp.]